MTWRTMVKNQQIIGCSLLWVLWVERLLGKWNSVILDQPKFAILEAEGFFANDGRIDLCRRWRERGLALTLTGKGRGNSTARQTLPQNWDLWQIQGRNTMKEVEGQYFLVEPRAWRYDPS